MMATAEGGARRVAVLADVHGNLVALQAVLADIARQEVEALIVAGDMVGFGPHPDGVVDVLVAWGARMIRGNHEADYVAPYGTALMPASWRTDPRLRSLRWTMERLGPERRAFLAALPDRLTLDKETLVVHGSPRRMRDGVLAVTSEQDVEIMWAGEEARLTFVGHTHQPVIWTAARRCVVNVGSVGLSMDGDPRAAYALATREHGGHEPWLVQLRRVAFDSEAAIAAYGTTGLRAADPGFAEIMARELRTARSYFLPWLHASREVASGDVDAALVRYLAAHP
jgi:predicted phosphodiesterase